MTKEVYVIGGIVFVIILFTFMWMIGPYLSHCCACSCKPKDGELILLEETGEVGTSYRSFNCGCCYFVHTRIINERKLMWVREVLKSNRNCSTNDVCVICLEGLVNNVTVLKCKHGFHDKCIRNWLFEKESNCCPCPLCHKYISSQKIILGILSKDPYYPITLQRNLVMP